MTTMFEGEIVFDRETLRKFKKSYKYAEAYKSPQFQFQGKTFNTAFAKYLIEYLEPFIGMLDNNPFKYPSKRVD